MSAKSWIRDDVVPQQRTWEQFYRNRWQYDKIVSSTHGVNCTGGCTWNIHVKDGIVTWEMQGLDYPMLEHGLPPYEPSGCHRGISYSWYHYSPLRVKYPYARGALLDLWEEARRRYDDPVEAWASLVNDPDARQRWQRARGKGGFRLAHWDTVLDIMAAANLHTIKKHGPDRIAGFSPIPAMVMISYAGGARMLQLMGGLSLSFYDWYCDLPCASPETWGEQTDVHESADWYNAKLLAVMGANLNMTRTPDCHFAADSRHNGTKMYVFAPDFSQVSKYADEWMRINAGQDGAWWMAVNHMLLKEYPHELPVPYFIDYNKRYTDAPLLVELHPKDGHYELGQLLRANRLDDYHAQENGEWKFLMWDVKDARPRMPMGTVGFRHGAEKGKWNLLLKNGQDGADIDPALTLLDDSDATVLVRFDDFGKGVGVMRGVPAKRIATTNGEVIVATVYDVLMAQYGVPRGLPGAYPESYDDDTQPYTPAWSEPYTGLSRDNLIKFAREWGTTAEYSKGKCIIIIGAGINHWYHGNLMYRAGIHALMFCGCVGVNGGGLAMMILWLVLLRQAGHNHLFTTAHLHTLGCLLLAFCIFWVYLWTSQHMLIWYANIPEETSYYLFRHFGGWSTLSLLNVVLNWLIPFFILLQRATKQNDRIMMQVAIIVLAGRWMDLYLMIMPPAHGATPLFGLWEIGPTIAMFGAFFYMMAAVLSKHPLFPINDPYLMESLPAEHKEPHPPEQAIS